MYSVLFLCKKHEEEHFMERSTQENDVCFDWIAPSHWTPSYVRSLEWVMNIPPCFPQEINGVCDASNLMHAMDTHGQCRQSPSLAMVMFQFSMWFFSVSFSSILAPRMHLISVTDVSKTTFLCMASPTIRTCFFAGLSLSGGNVLESWVIVNHGLRLRLTPLPNHKPYTLQLELNWEPLTGLAVLRCSVLANAAFLALVLRIIKRCFQRLQLLYC